MLNRTRTITLWVGLGILIAATPAFANSLEFVEAVPLPALPSVQAVSVAVSPDGGHVYVAAGTGDALVAFSRDAGTGELTQIQTVLDNTDGVDGLDTVGSVTVSPDGVHVYTASTRDSAVAAFSRNPGTGLLTFVEAEFEGVGGVQGLEAAHMVTVSPDGAHVYVASPGDTGGMPPVPGRVSVFERDPSTGELTFVEAVTDDMDGVVGLGGVVSVVISPDGAHAYTTAFQDDALAVFERNAATGELSFVEVQLDGVGGVDGLDGANEVEVSPDGAHVYAVSIMRAAFVGEDALVTFDRNATTGELTFADVQFEGVGGVFGMEQPSSVVLDPDGHFIFTTGVESNSLAVFDRASATGLPSFAEAKLDGVDGVDGLEGARWADLSPDGAHVYVASALDAKVAVFELPLRQVPALGPAAVGALGLLLMVAGAVGLRRGPGSSQ